jgi:hypothetical protein
MRFEKWIDTLVEEKGYDREQVFQVEGKSGTNFIPLGVVVDTIKIAPLKEREAIKDVIVRLDFVNADVADYFRHLAQAIAI